MVHFLCVLPTVIAKKTVLAFRFFFHFALTFLFCLCHLPTTMTKGNNKMCISIIYTFNFWNSCNFRENTPMGTV